jgi:hypothetical protein
MTERATLCRVGLSIMALISYACGAPLAEPEPQQTVERDEIVAHPAALGGPPEANCSSFTSNGKGYWFCPTNRSWTSARTKCQEIGYDLVSIGSPTENAFVDSHLSLSAWTAGTDAAVEGAWRWPDNLQFWMGSSGGAAVAGAYNNWKFGQPNNTSNQDCLLIDNSDGKWSDESCIGLKNYVCEGDTCPSDPNKTEPGQCDCGTPDTDGDGDTIADCADGCPSDGDKTAPGLCGCGVSDDDTDDDGVIDCHDQCPTDPRFTEKGDCGCSDDPAPAGAACNDGLCAASTTCDASGFCGNPQSCKPDVNCVLKYFRAVPYWFCDTDRSYSSARTRCQSVGMDLTVIEDADEASFVAGNNTVHAFIGASDSAQEGEWFWLSTGEQFWTGGKFGEPVDDAYTTWGVGEPDNLPSTDDCAVTQALLPFWEVTSCLIARDYVCERIDQCEDDPNKQTPGVCGCGIADTNSDGDAAADCSDACPDDATKTAPGTCGCGVADTDSDGDQIPNCVDECPNDNDRTAGGTCGCPSSPTPIGTSCCDGFCGSGTCDGAGHCGAAPSTCAPDPACSCSASRVDGVGYWFCPCSKTRDAAEIACEATTGRQLLQIDGGPENAYAATRIVANTWIAANDRGVEAEWRWSTRAHGDAGPRLWTGTATGAPHFGRYNNWQSNEPGGGASSDCAAMSSAPATRGQWFDTTCGSSAQFACEVGLQRLDCAPVDDVPGGCDLLGEKCDPPPRDDVNCTPLDEVFVEPGGEAAQKQKLEDCTTCVNDAQAHGVDPRVQCTNPWPVNPGPVPCSGSAAPPPAGSTCGSFLDGLPAGHEFLCKVVAGSWGASVTSCETTPCASGQCGLGFFCSQCPPGQVCPCEEDFDCNMGLGGPNKCLGTKVCGTLVEECPTGDNDIPPLCEEIEICAIDTLEDEETFTEMDVTGDLTVVPTTSMQTAFGAADVPSNAVKLPDSPPCPNDPDPANCLIAENHKWCRYDTPDEVTARTVTPPARNADAGKPAKVRFFFTPAIDYDYDLAPGPLGLMQFKLGAHASLTAGAEIRVLKAVATLDVIDALLQVEGGLFDDTSPLNDDVCGVSTSDSHLIILEQQDILPADFKIDLPDPALQQDCIAGLQAFQEAADRATKSFNDVRELLRQYEALKSGDLNFGVGFDGLCDQIASELPEDFPGPPLDCSNLSPEDTINRFVDYYVHLAVDKLGREVADDVANKIDAAFGPIAAELAPVNHQNNEEIVLVNTTFPVGPIPVNIQVLLTVFYGVSVHGKAEFRPGSLIRQILFAGATSADASQPFAYAGAVGTPRAGASLALFVGVGFDVGIAAAKVGIEGSISLGTIGLPLEAGAGFSVATQPDTREPADDLDPAYTLVDEKPLIPTKKYSINAVYKYGASLTIENLLHGNIDLVVKLKFLFFSKRYRAHIASFKGMCTPGDPTPEPFCKIDIFGGYGVGAAIPFEMLDWGTVLMPSSFLQLKKFKPAEIRAAGSEPFDSGRVGQLFFDSLCTCVDRFDLVPPADVEECARSQDCCGFEEGETCFADPADGRSLCSACRAAAQSCNELADCCPRDDYPQTCLNDPNDMESFGRCVRKSKCGEPCSQPFDCDETVTPALQCNGATCVRVDGMVCAPVM